MKPDAATSRQAAVLHLNLRPFYVTGLFIVLLISPLMRGLFFSAELLVVQVVIGITFLFCAYDHVLRRDPFRPVPQDYAMVALVVAYALSLFTAVHIRPAVGEVMEMAAALMVYWMAARATTDEKRLDRLLALLYLSAISVAGVGFLAAASVFDFPGAYVDGTILSTFQYKNALAVYLVTGSLLGIGLSLKVRGLLPKVLLAAGNTLLMVVILGTQSRGGWILYPVALALYLYLIPVSVRWRGVYHLLIPLSVALACSRPVYGAFGGPEPDRAISYLALAIGAAVLLQSGYHALGRFLNRSTVADSTRRLVAIGGLVYCLSIAGVYMLYAGAAFPNAAAGVVPGEVAARAAKVDAADPSYRSRIEASLDALGIVQDYPITGTGGGGWNALYHQYQDRLYWTTEVHNHFAQVWVEAGTIGFLALVALWALFIRSFRRLRRRAYGDGLSTSILAAGVAALTFGVHSAFDFDLSLPAIGFVLYALMGASRGVLHSVPAAIGRKTRSKLPSEPVPRARTGVLFGLALAGTLLAVALIVPSWRFYQAGVLGAQGTRAIYAGNLAAAENAYRDARRLDSYTASYAADLAQVYAARSVASGDESIETSAVNQARDAARLAPYDPRVAGALANVYGMIRKPDLAVAEARRLLDANPLFIPNYEMYGRVLIASAIRSLDDGDRTKARDYLGDVDDLSGMFTARIGQRDDVPAGLSLVLGQAAYLQGNYDKAGEMLAAAVRDKGVASEASLWQAALLHTQGEEEAATKLLAELMKQNTKAGQMYEDILTIPHLVQ